MINIQDRIYDGRDSIKNLILSVVNGDVKEVELPFNNIKHYIDIMESLGLELTDKWFYKLKANVEFNLLDKRYDLSGDMFDSDTLKFSISE